MKAQDKIMQQRYMNEENVKLKTYIDQLESMNDEQCQQLRLQQDEIKQNAERIELLQNRIDVAQQEKESLVAENSQLVTQKHSLVIKTNRYQFVINELKTIKSVQNQRTSNKLQETAVKQIELTKQNAKLKTQLEELASTNKNLKSTLETQSKELINTKSQMKQMLQTHNYTKREAVMLKSDNDYLANEKQKLHQKAEIYKFQVNELKMQLAELQQDPMMIKIRQLTESIQALNKKNSKLEEELKIKESMISQAELCIQSNIEKENFNRKSIENDCFTEGISKINMANNIEQQQNNEGHLQISIELKPSELYKDELKQQKNQIKSPMNSAAAASKISFSQNIFNNQIEQIAILKQKVDSDTAKKQKLMHKIDELEREIKIFEAVLLNYIKLVENAFKGKLKNDRELYKEMIQVAQSGKQKLRYCVQLALEQAKFVEAK
uniref:Uncharacterized protein n=1 Tax=Trepomonas sp. PC1 TaxID=1076344 RepID=A0A146K1Q4_9EUKA|eukprot:JAP89764.1 Hypothetical protein TPC1_30741 [Trepomonas sp. PC1]